MELLSETKTINLQKEGRILFLELNRPDVLNAMDVEMIHELNETMREIRERKEEILIITGSGRGFSAGGDIRTMLTEMDESQFDPVMDKISEMIRSLYTMPKLVISAIHGPAAGLGFSFALAADYLIASPQAKFAMNFIKIGLIPDGGGHFFMDKRLGPEKAKRIIWEGNNMEAAEALEAGLIDEIAGEDVLDAARSKADEWLNHPVLAMIATKQIMSNLNVEKLDRVLGMEKVKQLEMRRTEDHQEGITAFLGKRKPEYKGR
ncbi:enoyl-CoA hydratase [Bacillus marinisedimentorum]|uniref:enoyl-CoA hydratase n=1 Tax=Bacillus marinisedimentorum TaxID=1821260 RepID=UPI0007E0B43B|nr:enoyl-CoA hydratase [Bacillus marinisedimentorum]